jgi:hypothetical protein
MTIENLIQSLEDAITKAEGVVAIPHPRFGGRQFEWKGKEIGHIHWNGDLDILFKKDIHDVLIKENIAQEHKWVPNAGWITFPLLSKERFPLALDLLLFSYYQKRRKAEADNSFSAEISALKITGSVKKLI